MQVRLQRGKIIWAIIPDKNGYAKPGPRPAIVSADVAITSLDDEVPVIACSTVFPTPPQSDQILIHNSYQRTAPTQLPEPTVAVCSWTHALKYSEIASFGGYLSGKKLYPIIELMVKLKGGSEPPTPATV